MKRIVIGITGASGTIYGVRLLEVLQANPQVETHLVLSKWAKANLAIELPDYTPKAVKALADVTYSENNMGAAIASGSFQHDGMVVVPASMKSVAAMATGLGDNLIGRAADVTLKEKRPLIVVPRETPLSQLHLRNLLTLADMGVTIVPPIPAFYNRPQTIQDLVDHTVMKLLDQLHLENDLVPRWTGFNEA
ncbi:UbiX family flavin prenyltransferase [Loigolactobacillus bifermentans]|uniref:Flavin prenyltransferase UbiX n=1 Tax=Loigolactobacillus bifermentans DSM 20003 TaxID=1423726 RepID=A0A0R1H1T2_9LACO|nr:UbiX family flavin prenyltransferase [Loigolactobacillus bifermentans]KRK40550.1 ubiX protein [Loigolactobacillus bifermentans DSM 20003]QGG59757.1 UbiX family flavin prenyltransferase [Loigolactobacillus bifermentans]